MRNPMCGDEVKVRIKLVKTKIIDISAIVRGCALCEASAGLVVDLFKNKKDLPKGVPEENVYENTHVLLYVFYAIAVASVVLLMVNQ